MLIFDNVSKSYGAKTALDEMSVQIPFGRVVGILGLNGSGKSTTLKLASGLLSPTKGSITLNNMPVASISTSTIAYVPEVMSLYDWMSASQLALFIHGLKPPFQIDTFNEFLLEFEIDISMKIGGLSKGQKNLVKIAAGISQPNQLLVLDEPLEGIDPPKREKLLSKIRDNLAEDQIILMSSHLVHDIELYLSDVLFLNKGKLTFYNTLETLRLESTLMDAFGEYTE